MRIKKLLIYLWKGNFDFAPYASRGICFKIISFQKASLVWKCYIILLTPYVYFAFYAQHPIYTFNKNLVYLIYIRTLLL